MGNSRDSGVLIIRVQNKSRPHLANSSSSLPFIPGHTPVSIHNPFVRLESRDDSACPSGSLAEAGEPEGRPEFTQSRETRIPSVSVTNRSNTCETLSGIIRIAGTTVLLQMY